MNRIVLSPRAQADLEAIWNYTEEHWSADQAEHYVRAIWTAIEAIASDTRKGRACDDVRPGYRKYPAGSHVLFYRTSDAGIDVVRILHERMDFEQHL